MNLLVTFKPINAYKTIIDKRLHNYAHVQYLDELNDQNINNILTEIDIIFAWNISQELTNDNLTCLKKCKFIQLLSAGANHVPFKYINDSILISSNAGAYAKPMAEHVLSLIFALAKSLLPRHIELKKGIFNQQLPNKCLEGLSCGILGFGGIGKSVAHLLAPFNMKIFAINTSGKTDSSVYFIGTLKDLNYILENVDIIVITLPLNKYTYNLINIEKLNLMKKDGMLINVARGDIVVEEDLYYFLKNNHDFKAGIDAWWIEPFSHGFFKTNYTFFELPNFLGSPHNSAIVPGVIEEAISLAIANVLNFITHKEIRGIVKRDDYIS